MGDRMGSSPIDRTNRKDDNVIVFFHFLPKMMRRCRSVSAHVRCARATQMQAHYIGDPAGYCVPVGKRRTQAKE